MRAGHGIFGSGLEEVSVWVWAAVAANVALWAIFGWGSQQLEKSMATYSTQSKAGSVAYSCLNDPKNDCFHWDYSANNLAAPADGTTLNPAVSNPAVNNPATSNTGGVTTTADGVSYIELPPSAFVTDPGVKACVSAYWTSIGGVESFSNQDATVFPAGSTWTITAPGWAAHTFVGADGEKWSLVSAEYPDLSFIVNANFASSLGGNTGLFSGKEKTTVKGTGPLPAPCARKEVSSTPPPVATTPDPNLVVTPPPAVTDSSAITTTGACYSVTTQAANVRSTPSTADATNIKGKVSQGDLIKAVPSGDWGSIVNGQWSGNFIHLSVLTAASGCP